MPAFKKFNPAFERDWVKKVWVIQNELCPACAAGESLEEYPRDPNADRGIVFRFDEPGLSVGPGHEFRGGDRETRGEDDEVDFSRQRGMAVKSESYFSPQ